NVYCDESCHLEHDNSNIMVLGGVWCPKEKVHDINNEIKNIKAKYGISPTSELKWTKISPSKEAVYKELVNLFFNNKVLHFRGLLVPNKSKLKHKSFNQDHSQWYYKMYFEMLKQIINPSRKYNIYIDIKDRYSAKKANELHDVISNSQYDFQKRIIRKLQPIRSNEVQIMQITDVLIGAFGYNNRKFPKNENRSQAKQAIVDLIKQRSGYTLTQSTLYREDKFNLFVWEAK
ncbi:MAG: DUF3800 domain-containing protein, partial [Bacilli bacterium]|nr:DUF3800 domain-containing protein [Bacilli bacterium]